MPIHRRKRLTAFKTEATAGTAITLSNSDATTVVFNTILDAVIPVTEREAQRSSGNLASIPGGQMVKASLMHHWAGSGTGSVGANFEPLLLAAGLTPTVGSNNVSYLPVTGNTNCVSMKLYQSSARWKLAAGLMFDLTINLNTGKPVEFLYEGQGVWGGTGTGTLTPTFVTTPKPPIFGGGTFTVGGTALRISNCSIKFNNQLTVRPDPNAASSYIACWIGTRKISVTLDPEAEAANDFYSQFTGITTGAMAIVVGSVAGNILHIDAPKLQLNAPPQDGERGQMEIDQLEGLCVENTSAGDDELSISQL